MYYRTIKLLWHSGYWDGPISGMCEVDGKKHWFSQAEAVQDEVLGEMYFQLFDKEHNEEDYDRIRFYYVYALPEEIVTAITAEHDLFIQYVGAHTDYDEKNKREVGAGVKPEEEWRKYYDKRQAIDVKSHVIRENRIGWFDSNSIYYYGKEKI